MKHLVTHQSYTFSFRLTRVYSGVTSTSGWAVLKKKTF